MVTDDHNKQLAAASDPEAWRYLSNANDWLPQQRWEIVVIHRRSLTDIDKQFNLLEESSMSISSSQILSLPLGYGQKDVLRLHSINTS